MLYVTTRNKHDVYTAYSTLCRDCGRDGGLFIPFRFPDAIVWDPEEWSRYTFGERVAKILNLFYRSQLKGTDIDFCVGRNPARLVPMFHRIYVGELWHNAKWSLSAAEQNLTSLLLSEDQQPVYVGNWTKIAVRMGLLFGLFGDLAAQGCTNSGKTIDVAVASKDFTSLAAVWYARRLGLPVGNIICGCAEDSSIWELLHQGAFSTRAGEISANLERLICSAVGFKEAAAFRDVCSKGGIYVPVKTIYENLRDGLFAAVISKVRLEATAGKVYHTNKYLMGPDTTMAFAGLQDYRANTYETGCALILCEETPAASAEFLLEALGVTKEEL